MVEVARPRLSLASRGPTNHLSWRTNAMLTALPSSADPSSPSTDAAVCEAAGCRRALTLAQLQKAARACSARCRAAAHREKRKQSRLAEIDAAVRALLKLRAEIERG